MATEHITEACQDMHQPTAGKDSSVDHKAASTLTHAAGSTALHNNDQMELQTFPLFDLPPELWIRCCHFAVTEPDAIVIDDVDNQGHVQALVAQPAITKTCKAIRAETIPIFYQMNEFRFLDTGECALYGLRYWVKAIWSSRWPLVQNCTIESKYADIVDHMRTELDEFAEVEFDSEAPEAGISKILKFMAKETEVGDGAEEEQQEDGSDHKELGH